MEQSTSPRKKLKSPGVDALANINMKTSVTCANVPESLFDATAAKKHFSKFGRVQKIRLFPKKQVCIVEYDQPLSAERAMLNAGAYDGFMFDVTRTKPRVRRRSKKEDDPDWVPDSDVEEELSAMSGTPIYRTTRQKPMEIEATINKPNISKRTPNQSPIRNKLPVPVREKKSTIKSQPSSGIESPIAISLAPNSLSTSEAAAELHQLRNKVSLTPDEQWRTLDARDRILRAWGGAGSRVKIGGATIGTCPDMCPEKELLHRQAEHQVMTLETVPGSDGQLEPWRAVKQYSRSSADQEIPMCYELRPAPVLMRTCAYLLNDIADTQRQVTLADWFHFMWDRLRGIRKDIAQQALCCAESIYLVEMCARFHAHCAARLADLEYTQFDQKLNTDNLTKCLQTLKHMYVDVGPDQKPREAEFRGYIALLNLGDANFWWEIKQLPQDIQKSQAITFAIEIFNALDNNNYVKFFRLVKEKASYLQACILLRYFNDVRARALARIVKAYAPRGGSRYPAEELMKSLAFESVESMKSFINHYGLRFGKDETELTVILDRNQFIEDMDPYPIARSIKLIETKRQNTVGEVIAGGALPSYNYAIKMQYSSFNKDGKLKETALTAADQGYDTKNDSNKDVQALRAEILRLSQSGRSFGITERLAESKPSVSVKRETRTFSPGKSIGNVVESGNEVKDNKSFSFKPAIPVAATEIIKNSPEKIFGRETKNVFSFSKPESMGAANMFLGPSTGNLFKPANVFDSNAAPEESKKLFEKISNENKDPFQNAQHFFKKTEVEKFGRSGTELRIGEQNNNLFKNIANKNIFAQKEENIAAQNEFGTKNIFAVANAVTSSKPETTLKFETTRNIFAKAAAAQGSDAKPPLNIFAASNHKSDTKNIFAKPENENKAKSFFTSNGDIKLSPSSLFKSAINVDNKEYSIFQSKNKAPSVAENIFNSVNLPKDTVYDFVENQLDTKQQEKLNEAKIKEEMEREIQEKIKEEEAKRLELKRQQERQKEDERRKQEEERRKQEDLKHLEEKRKREEERKQEELRKKLEEERKAELKRKAEEEERKFKERVEKESTELIKELINEIRDETLRKIIADEVEKMKTLMSYADIVTEEIWIQLCGEMCESEMKAEKFWTEKLMKKWFNVWRKQFLRNYKRRGLLEDTPIWLPEKTHTEEAASLRREVENAALRNMNAIHRGYRFSGDLRLLPAPQPYNIMEIIKSPLLKRMKQINYPYNKCLFWKVTLVSPGEMKWMLRKIELQKWLLDVFSDKERHEVSESLIHVKKQSWNNLIDFAISVCLTSKDSKNSCSEAVEGSNGLLFYATENNRCIAETIQDVLKHKYPYQVIPVAFILPEMEDLSIYNATNEILTKLVSHNIISDFKIFLLDPQNIFDSLNAASKRALKWLAKRCPLVPPLEVDHLKSICQRHLGNEIWYRLKSDMNSRVNAILKDLHKLVNCYNAAVDKLTDAITNEDLFNYSPFPLEFKQYLDQNSPYPKPYEFIPTNARNSENISAIKDMMKKLKLPSPESEFHPINVISMQDNIRKYCNQIGWFENPEEVVCKVVARLPNQFSDLDMPREQFTKYYELYDLADILNIIVFEKINRLNNFDSRCAIYESSALVDYRNSPWLYKTEVLLNMKHKTLEYEDDIDLYIEAKRRKIAEDSMEYLMLEDKDCTMVEENIKATDKTISNYSNCKEAVEQLEQQVEEERKKSMELENLLRAALSNV